MAFSTEIIKIRQTSFFSIGKVLETGAVRMDPLVRSALVSECF